MKALTWLFLLFVVPFSWADGMSETQSFIQKMQLASQQNNFSGTFVLQQGQQLIGSRILHRYEHADELEKVVSLDGPSHEYVRHNEVVTSYFPDSKTVRLEKRQTQDTFPALLAFAGASLGDYYQFKLAEPARVAGRDCRMIDVDPRDQLRYGYRLCAALDTNLLLQAQTIDASKNILEQIMFTSLTFGNLEAKAMLTDYSDTTGWKVDRGAAATSIDSGWLVSYLPSGFKKIHELRLLLSSHPGEKNDPQLPPHEVVQLVFSDSLATISVFVEPKHTGHHVGGLVRHGATTIVSRMQGEFMITLVGEVPAETIKSVLDSIQYKTK